VFDGHVLHMMVTPDWTEPPTVQVPKHDCRQPQPIGPVPQVFWSHSAISAPPTRCTQS
jgi:hypothetical protein